MFKILFFVESLCYKYFLLCKCERYHFPRPYSLKLVPKNDMKDSGMSVNVMAANSIVHCIPREEGKINKVHNKKTEKSNKSEKTLSVWATLVTRY